MSSRYLLAPEAASDLVQIWRYTKPSPEISRAMLERYDKPGP